ncbi:epoxide hydrolase 1-like [Rutidosis leptorrhynchoides]|uniref:epoxide hydrolase 1-like n=1 Tax=Rutidosis leptorrhynchoides TaxID=125765 RepID=UPI003A98E1F4
MDGIQHKTVQVNGINMHVAEKGPPQGPVILFIHGFPELWYSWRHQITSMADLGYRAIAPDLRGFGDTDAPEPISSYTCMHVVGDLIALIDAVAGDQDKIFVVGHDWGALIAWYLCLFRPDKVKALVNMSVVFQPRSPKIKPIQMLRKVFGDDYYICRFQDPGVMEAEFAELGTERIIKELYTYHEPGPLFKPKGKGFNGRPIDAPITLPPWLSQDDINFYTAKYEKTGFRGGINYYRNLDINWELSDPWTGRHIKVPVKFIVGDLDLTYNSPGTKEYIHNGGFKKFVPFLQEVVVMEGVGHFVNEEKSDEVNKHIHDFFHKF